MNQYFDIFWRFLYLACISFGGPAAHLGYFQRYFIEKQQWLDLPTYSRMVALSQFLPGPASSQVGFSLGYHRAGLMGAIMAFLGFTLPSFILLYLLAVLGVNFANSVTYLGMIYGLKLFAVVIVADAIIAMSKVFCQHKSTRLIAIATTLSMSIFTGIFAQLIIVFSAGLICLVFFKNSFPQQPAASANATSNISHHGVKRLPLLLFAVLLFGLPWLRESHLVISLFNSFYQAGSFVFGGGHVVLPMLQQTLTQPLASDTFILGYASAQAVPGPMFTLATFLGANILLENPLLGAILATFAIFLPGFLLVLGLQGAWQKFAFEPKVTGFVSGVNAAVVGLLAAAFYQPIAINAIFSWHDVAFVTCGFILLKFYRLPILALVASFIGVGILMTL